MPTARGELETAGLSAVRVNVSGWGARLDDVTRDQASFDALKAGLLALASTELRLEISSVLSRSTAAGLPEVAAGLVETLGPDRVAEILVTIPTDAPNEAERLSYEEALPVLLQFDRRAAENGIPVRLARGGPPPCLIQTAPRPTHLFSMNEGVQRRPDQQLLSACATCLVRDRCEGFNARYIQRFGQPTVTPIKHDRIRRRLSMISSVAEQIEKELVTPNKSDDPTTGLVHEEIIRVNFRCNQACRFCYVSTHLPEAPGDRVRNAIEEALGRGSKITLSGGEPMLNPRVLEYVQLAAERSDLPVQLQTNAVLLDDATRVQQLERAGLTEAFVSLHGSYAELSDRITGAPGTFDRTVAGLDNLEQSSIKVQVNFVITRQNAHDLTDWLELTVKRWPSALPNVSFVAPSSDVVPRDREMIPTYSQVVPELHRALVRAQELQVEVVGFESMCGIPLCLVPPEVGRQLGGSDLPSDFHGGEFVKPEPCSRCSLNRKCYGLRRGYDALHGHGELRPVPAR